MSLKISIYNQYSDNNAIDYAKRYQWIENNFTGSVSHTMPLNFRKLTQVQLSAHTRIEQNSLGDNRSMHVKAFMAATVGSAFTAVARIIRIALFTVFLLPAILVRGLSAVRYGVDGAIPELLKRYGEEWVDLFVSIGSAPLGLAKTFVPTAGENFTNSVTQYYIERADRRTAFDEKLQAGKEHYETQVAEANKLVNNAENAE